MARQPQLCFIWLTASGQARKRGSTLEHELNAVDTQAAVNTIANKQPYAHALFPEIKLLRHFHHENIISILNILRQSISGTGAYGNGSTSSYQDSGFER